MTSILGTLIPTLIVIAILSLSIFKIYKDKKSGKLCGDCTTCDTYRKCSLDSKTIKEEMLQLVRNS